MAHFVFCRYASPLGELLLTGREEGLCGLQLPGEGKWEKLAQENPDLPLFRKTRDWLDRYFAGQGPRPEELPLAPCPASPFREAVWRILCQIPYGTTRTYGDIARELSGPGQRMAAQAVGGAVGGNPIAILIPCHRVLGAGGNLTGYGGGLTAKVFLLQLEGVDTSQLVWPQKTRAQKRGRA